MARWDAAVVGAGIGGLVCGCVLARAGRRVVLVEKEHQPGGCCVSFRRQGFAFDAGVNSLAGCGPREPLRRVLEGLGLGDLPWLRPHPREKLTAPGISVLLGPDAEDSCQELIRAFPAEGQSLKAFFRSLSAPGGAEPGASPWRHETYDQVLEAYFADSRLRCLLGVLMGNLGLSPSRAAAGTARALLREFVFGGGYYPAGGVGRLTRRLAERFGELGGTLLLGQRVSRIPVQEGRVRGVLLAEGTLLESPWVVSNADASSTLLTLVGSEFLGPDYAARLRGMEPSPSAFLVFLGLDRKLATLGCEAGNLLHLFRFDPQGFLGSLGADPLAEPDDYLYCLAPSAVDPSLAPPGCESVYLMRLTEDRGAEYWAENREAVADRMVAQAERAIPGLARHVVLRETATPETFERITGNHRGAIYGWAALPSQAGRGRLAQETPVVGLYLAGHWTQPGSGVSSAAGSGYLAARLVLRGEG